MAGTPTERDLRQDLEDVRDDQAGDVAGDELTVEFADADPEHRPTGMSFDDETATLTYDLWGSQRDTLDAVDTGEHDVVAFLAGYGTGKSVTGARWLIANALEYPGSRFLALGVDFTKARDATFRILFEQLPGDRTGVVTSSYNGPETSPAVVDYNRAEHRLTLVNDTVIKLGSADKWNRYAGDEYGAIWLDEPSHYGSELHDLLEMMGSRLRGVDGPKTQLWTLTGNGYNAAWEILEKQQDATGDPIGLDLELVRASTLENPYLDDATKERFRRQYSGTSREEQALHGGFAAAQGLVYDQFRRDRHVIDHADARDRVDGDWRVYGYDAGWKDPRVLLEIGRTDYGQLVVLDEFHESGSHVEDAIRWLKENQKPKGWIHAEHEPADIQKLRQAGYGTEKAEKSIDAGISQVRRRLESDDSGRTGLLVSDRCRNLIREFLGYKEEHVGSSQASDHCLDSLRYAVMGLQKRGGSWKNDDDGEYLWTFEFGEQKGGPVDMSGVLSRNDRSGISFI